MPPEEPPTGQPPNPYGPPPNSGNQHGSGWPPPQGPPTSGPGHSGQPWGPPPQHPPHQQWGPPGQPPGGMSGAPTLAPGQPPPPRRGGRSGIIALVAVVVLVIAGGGAAWALANRDDGDNEAEKQRSSTPGQSNSTDDSSPSASSSPSATEPSSPGSTSPALPGTGGENGNGGNETPTLRGYLRAESFQEDWEFRWEDKTFNARAVVARDHPNCTGVAADDQLRELGCKRAVTATYVNERDQVTITHFYLKFGDQPVARKVEAMKKLDTLLKLDGDAVWDGWTQGGWRASRVQGVVLFTAVTAPDGADADVVSDYLAWAHTDFREGLRIRRAF